VSNLKSDEYKKLVRKALNHIGVSWKEGEDLKDTKNQHPMLNHDLFLDLQRNNHRHTPDLFISEGTIIPCETKAPGEIYEYCRYSHAHVCSYLLQMIYGQCSSYGDLFRLADDQLYTYLIYPQEIFLEKKDNEIFDIEGIFRKITESTCNLYLEIMNLHSIEFEAPNFPHSESLNKYDKFEYCIKFLATKIKFEPNN
jgi:hypothetical protein